MWKVTNVNCTNTRGVFRRSQSAPPRTVSRNGTGSLRWDVQSPTEVDHWLVEINKGDIRSRRQIRMQMPTRSFAATELYSRHLSAARKTRLLHCCGGCSIKAILHLQCRSSDCFLGVIECRERCFVSPGTGDVLRCRSGCKNKGMIFASSAMSALFTSGAGLLIIGAFVVIRLTSRSNSPSRYMESERRLSSS